MNRALGVLPHKICEGTRLQRAASRRELSDLASAALPCTCVAASLPVALPTHLPSCACSLVPSVLSTLRAPALAAALRLLAPIPPRREHHRPAAFSSVRFAAQISAPIRHLLIRLPSPYLRRAAGCWPSRPFSACASSMDRQNGFFCGAEGIRRSNRVRAARTRGRGGRCTTTPIIGATERRRRCTASRMHGGRHEGIQPTAGWRCG